MSVAAHATQRGWGGVNGGARALVDLCQLHHMEAGEHGTGQRRDFEAKYSVNLDDRAEVLAAEFDQTMGREPCIRCGETGGHALICPTVEARREQHPR